ncbi:ATP-binding protein [Azospirillum picis]|uniref:histidine kinase n=1 Tax=Azospirillum picis TaxID=488438 RepID=A0ABU0MGY1_9PROT|nr:ATP-binding protein [Azospirillum picis]MBP2299069.1 PAS domain S-box-containing protein [Azospirillum picis]MDQ0532689.1 PAS domain S-box-containing protein [Azospirillum picis]
MSSADMVGRSDAPSPPPQRRRRFGIALRISLGLSVMALLVMLIGGLSISSFRLFRAEVTVLSTSTLPEMMTSGDLYGSLQKLVAQLPQLAGATSTPQRRSIYNGLVAELDAMQLLAARMRALLKDNGVAGPERDGGRDGEMRLLEQTRSTLLILAATVADLNAEVTRQIESSDRQAEAARGLTRLAASMDSLPDAGAWAAGVGALTARAAGATQLDHLSRLKGEARAAERLLADLGQRAAAAPAPVGQVMATMHEELFTLLLAPEGLFESSIERLQARNRAQALTGQARVLVEKVERSTRSLYDSIRGLSEERTGALARLITMRTRAVMLLGGASLILAVGVYFVFRRFLSSRLVALNHAVLARLAGGRTRTGQAMVQIPVDGDDEITDIGGSVRYFIDEIDRRQRALADNERRFRDLVEGSIQGIVIHRDFHPLYANGSFASMLGLTVAEAVALPSLLALVAVEERQLLIDNYDQLMTGAPPSSPRRMRAWRPDGGSLWVELTERRVDWLDGPAIQGVVVDVTREVEAEAALRQSRDAAERALDELRATQASLIQAEKMASLGQLVAGVAHEVNTPIGITITGASQIQTLVKEVSDRHEANALRKSDFHRFLGDTLEMANLILSNSTRAANLVQSFKLVAVDQSSDERRRFLLKDYIDELLRSLHPTYKTRTTLGIAVDCPPDLELDGYPGALSQILTNLVMNALIHALAPERPGRIGIAARLLADDCVELSVADDGQGIAPEVLPKIFDPFFTTRRGNGGSGLGLHIVYNLVTGRLRGAISVESRSGEGTRFTLLFPRVTATG